MFRNSIVIGVVVSVAIMVSLYVIVSTNSEPSLDPQYVEQCRELIRESMMLSVDAARAQLDKDNPDDVIEIEQFQMKADELQHQLDELQCSKNADKIVYGSFQQEMNQLEQYVADIVRESKESQ